MTLPSDFDDINHKVYNAFITKYGTEDYTIYPNDAGKTLLNLINQLRGETLNKAIEFVIQYMENKK